MSIQTVSEVAAVLAMAFFLALVVERIIQFVVRPLVENLAKAAGKSDEKAQETVGLILPWVSVIMGALLAWGFGLDLFSGMATAAGLTPETWITRLLTALVVAGGSNLLHDLWPSGSLEPLP